MSEQRQPCGHKSNLGNVTDGVETSTAPARSLDWGIVGFGLWFQIFNYGPTLFSFTLWINAWQKQFGVSASIIMLAIVLLSVSMAILTPIVGQLLDRMPVTIFVVIGAVSLGVGMVTIAFTSSLWQIFAIYATLISIGIVGLGPVPAQVLITRSFEEKRGLAMGIVTLGTSVGAIAVPPIIAFLLTHFGWQFAHISIGVAILVLVVPLTLIVGPTIEAKLVKPRSLSEGHFGMRHSMRLLQQRELYIPMLALLPFMIGLHAVQHNLGPFMSEHGFGPQLAAMLVSIGAVSAIVGKVSFGALADIVEHRLLFGLACLAQSLCLILLITGQDKTIFMLSFVMYGISTGGVLPLLGAMLGARIPREEFGSAFGIASIVLIVATFGAPAISWVREVTGSYNGALVAILVLLFGSALVMVLLPPIKKAKGNRKPSGEATG